MLERSQTDEGDVLPPLLNQLLALSWMFLFTFRSAGVFLLTLAGLLSVEQLEAFVDPVLSRLYLILLTVSIVVIVLRVMRSMQTKPPQLSPELHYPSTSDLPPATETTTRPLEENS